MWQRCGWAGPLGLGGVLLLASVHDRSYGRLFIGMDNDDRKEGTLYLTHIYL